MAHKKKVSIRKKKKRGNTLVILPKTSLLRSTKGTLFPRCYIFFFPFCVLSEAKRRAELPEEAFNHKLKVLL